MRKFNVILAAVFTLTLVFLVGGTWIGSNSAAQTDTPQALQDNRHSTKSYGRSSNLIEELYQELVEKTPALQKLEDDIQALQPKVSDLNGLFHKYDSKSYSYYSDASYSVKPISDSVLKAKINSL